MGFLNVETKRSAVEGIQAGTKRSPHGCDRPWKGGLHEQGSKDGM